MVAPLAPPEAKKPALPPTPLPPPPPSRNGAGTMRAPRRDFKVTAGTLTKPQKVVLYGPGGVGKTELASLLKDVGVRPLFLDLEDGSAYLDVDRIDDIQTWDELRGVLHDQNLWKDYGAVVIDSFTKAEELAAAWVVANITHEKENRTIRGLEDYGWGKGAVHVYETFLQLLADLDTHFRQGRQVVCICHECTANVANPQGDDWLRYEPRLQSPSSGKSSIRHRVKEWCRHMLFIGFDTAVNRDGKATGVGTRTIYPTELPTWWAKSWSLKSPIRYEKGDPEVWKQLLGK